MVRKDLVFGVLMRCSRVGPSRWSLPVVCGRSHTALSSEHRLESLRQEAAGFVDLLGPNLKLKVLRDPHW